MIAADDVRPPPPECTRDTDAAAANLKNVASMQTLAIIAVLLFTVAHADAQIANLTGKWTGTLTRTAPDGRSQSIDFMFDLTQIGKVLAGTAGPNAERQWAIEKGAVDGEKVTFRVQQPDGPMRTLR